MDDSLPAKASLTRRRQLESAPDYKAADDPRLFQSQLSRARPAARGTA